MQNAAESWFNNPLYHAKMKYGELRASARGEVPMEGWDDVSTMAGHLTPP